MPKKKVARANSVKTVQKSWFRRHPLRTAGLLVLLGGLVFALFRPTVIDLSDVVAEPASINAIVADGLDPEEAAFLQKSISIDKPNTREPAPVVKVTVRQTVKDPVTQEEEVVERTAPVVLTKIENPESVAVADLAATITTEVLNNKGAIVTTPPEITPSIDPKTGCPTGELKILGICTEEEFANNKCVEKGGNWDKAKRLCLRPGLIRIVAKKVLMREYNGGLNDPNVACKNEYAKPKLNMTTPVDDPNSLTQTNVFACSSGSDGTTVVGQAEYTAPCTGSLLSCLFGGSSRKTTSCCMNSVDFASKTQDECFKKGAGFQFKVEKIDPNTSSIALPNEEVSRKMLLPQDTRFTCQVEGRDCGFGAMEVDGYRYSVNNTSCTYLGSNKKATCCP